MPLSEYEQRVLEQMERQLSSDDPKLVNTLQGGGTRGVRRWLLVGAGALVGLAVLVLGAATSQPLVGVIGFVVMLAAVVVAFTPPRRGPVGVVRPDGTARPSPRSSRRSGFVSRMESRWDRRREDRGER